MTINKKELGKKIQKIRITSPKVKKTLRGQKPTLERFAELVGSNKSNVLRWENGENIPNKITLHKIASYGETTVERLLNEENTTNKLSEFTSEQLLDELNERGIVIMCNCKEVDNDGN